MTIHVCICECVHIRPYTCVYRTFLCKKRPKGKSKTTLAFFFCGSESELMCLCVMRVFVRDHMCERVFVSICLGVIVILCGLSPQAMSRRTPTTNNLTHRRIVLSTNIHLLIKVCPKCRQGNDQRNHHLFGSYTYYVKDV